ncbi:hypothetical protein H0H81_003606 [Sphagnurus paluster]|uniref:ADF-H domain-containing protein n=1 Tax=Sphagnurus paluster TaxID=117069 RepID=A0A9P7FYR8_9AGAR|nr:hypothetical protein H0H81_003606 [Sphagnurus paluster]
MPIADYERVALILGQGSTIWCYRVPDIHCPVRCLVHLCFWHSSSLTSRLLMFGSGLPSAEKPQAKRYYLKTHGLQPDKRIPDAWPEYQAYLARTSILIPLPQALYSRLPAFIKKTVLLDFPMYQFDAEGLDGREAMEEERIDELTLFDHGTGGLRELKHSIEDSEQVHIGFYREEGVSDAEAGFVVINYIPSSTPAVKKARALVHSRRVGSVFKKHQATLTVDHLDQLTPDAVRSALVQQKDEDEDSTAHTKLPMGRTASMPIASAPIQSQIPTRNPQYFPGSHLHDSPPFSHTKALPDTHAPPPIQPMRRAASEAPTPHTTNFFPEATPMAKSASMFSSFIRRKKKTADSAATTSDSDDAGPPPTPPKDKGKFSVGGGIPPPVPPHEYNYQANGNGFVYGHLPKPVPVRTLYQDPSGSTSEYAVVSHASSSSPHRRSPDEFGGVGGYNVQSQTQTQGYAAMHNEGHGGPLVQSMSLPLRGKWLVEPMDAAERLRRRQEEVKQRQREEAEAKREEARHREEMRRRKERQVRELQEEEEQRRASLEAELQRIVAERRRKEKREQEEEERKKAEIEERKRVDRERRMEEHRKLEQWRNDQARMAEESARRAEEARKKEEAERMKKIQLVEAKVKRSHNADALVSGWVTMQTHDSLLWKRRFYKFIGSVVYFYRNANDTHQCLDEVELLGKLRGLREWNEGYEDLEAIPHSFAIEFQDEQEHWSLFSDSEEEKYKLLGLLHHAAGL